MEKIPMTAQGFAALESEIKHLKGVERPAIIKAISEARAHGDLSENAEYHSAKERQSFIEGRVMELEDKVSRAQVIDVSKLSGKTVKFGATVSVIDEETEQKYVCIPSKNIQEQASVWQFVKKLLNATGEKYG
jgi:transcription elongation factor GreA